MEIKDLAGISEPLKKLIEVISTGVGNLSKPYLVRKNADAKAYEINVIAQAIKENQSELKSIDFSNEKLCLISLDNNSHYTQLSLAERTQQRTNFKNQNRQINIESITQKTAQNLSCLDSVSEEKVDNDWITRFFNYAEDISNEEMQELWAQILAGEIKKPKSYSLRTLEVLKNLSKEEAEVFLKFASLAISSSKISFVLNFTNEKLLQEKYNLNFNERLLLEELGLIAANDLVFEINETKSQPIQTVFLIGKICVLYNKNTNIPKQQLDVLVFTKIGKELLNLVNDSPELDYIQLLANKLDNKNGTIKYGYILEKSEKTIKHTELIDVPPINYHN